MRSTDTNQKLKMIIKSTNQGNHGATTILGFGSLLSETSARTTFPNLKSFRLGQINGYRRVFDHPASIFFQRNIANKDTKEMSSLSAESCPGSSFICSVFEVDDGLVFEDGVPATPFIEREEAFDIRVVPYKDFSLSDDSSSSDFSSEKKDDDLSYGVLCTSSKDKTYIERWGQQRFNDHYLKYGISSIWDDWDESSGLKPCGVYLRHCVLAAEKLGQRCLESFLDDTYLVDRKTTIREYLKLNPDLMDTLPPASLIGRYSG